MQGLSLREFISLKYKHTFPVIDLNSLLHEPAPYIAGVLEKIKPIKLFEEYLHTGYYPFFMEDDQTYYERLKQTVNHVLETDLPSVGKIDFNAVSSSSHAFIHHFRDRSFQAKCFKAQQPGWRKPGNACKIPLFAG